MPFWLPCEETGLLPWLRMQGLRAGFWNSQN